MRSVAWPCRHGLGQPARPPGIVLVLIVLAVGTYRLTLTTNGHFLWADEGHYTHSIRFLRALGEGSARAASEWLYAVWGRPGAVLLGTIPAAVQLARMPPGDPWPRDPHFYDVVSVFNVLLSLGILILFHRVAVRLLRDEWNALLATVVYGLLANTNLYIRHLGPYDMAMLIYMAALWLLLRQEGPGEIPLRRCVGVGLLAGLAHSVYPGYFYFPVILAVIVATHGRQPIRQLFAYGESVVAVFLAFDLLSAAVGKSYLLASLQGTRLIAQGSFEEGYIFLPRYLADVEGPVGYLLLVTGIASPAFLWRGPREERPLRIVLTAAAAGYLLHGTFSVVLHRMVFYGRTLHMYLPFLVLAAVSTIRAMPHHSLRRWATVAMVILSAVSFGNFVVQFAGVVSPGDVVWKYLGETPPGEIHSVQENERLQRPLPRGTRYVVVNGGVLSPIPEEYSPYTPPAGATVVADVPHPLQFPAYLYEGYSIPERRRFRERGYRVRIYRLPSAGGMPMPAR